MTVKVDLSDLGHLSGQATMHVIQRPNVTFLMIRFALPLPVLRDMPTAWSASFLIPTSMLFAPRDYSHGVCARVT